MNEFNAIVMTTLLLCPVHAETNRPALNQVQKGSNANDLVQIEQQDKGGKLNGYIREYYPNGNLAFVQQMKNGKINGEVKSYYESGSIKGAVRYINNLQEGISREYFKNGAIKEEVVYLDGQMMSLKKFDEQGKLVFNQIGKFDFGCAVNSNNE